MGVAELYRIGQVPERVDKSSTLQKPAAAEEFSQVLNKELQFSQHAQARIRSREIPWSDQVEARVSKGIEAAQKKGSREALILVDGLAVIANVKSKTIITAIPENKMRERIVTNIDSTVIV